MLSFIFVFSFHDKAVDIIFYDSIEYNDLKNNIITTKEKNFNIINYVSFNDKYCSYDDNTDSFLCFRDESSNNNFSFKVDSNLDFSLFSDSSFKISNLGYTSVVMFTDEYYYVINLNFTNLPIMNIKSIPKIRSNVASEFDKTIFTNAENQIGSQELSDNDFFASLSENNNSVVNSKIDIHVRGHDSSIYEKKSYKMSLIKDDNNNIVKNKQSLLGMYKDDDWVLDAMYIDYSKIRNKLSSDLWQMVTGQNILNGKYVELFIDNDYKGLYLLKEFVNRKSLNLDQDGSLIKAVMYLNADDTNINYINNKYFLLKSPDYPNYSSQHILNFLKNYYDCIDSQCDISDLILDNYDINNFLNYKVFATLIKGIDNNEHNNYYLAMKDSRGKIVKIPWDMDLTFGFTFTRINDYEYVNSIGFSPFYENSPKLNDMIKSRYWKIRNSGLSADDIAIKVDEYRKYIMDSGAIYRDAERWKLDVKESEFEDIKTWIYKRIEYLDGFYN